MHSAKQQRIGWAGLGLWLGLVSLTTLPAVLAQTSDSPPSKRGPAAGAGAVSDGPRTPYRPDASPHAGAAARELRLDVPSGSRVLRIPIADTIDLGLAAFIERALADHADVSLVVLDINTLGGRVDAAIRIRDVLLKQRMRTLAFVHPRAISAGALISLACDVIVMSSGASLGAVTPMSGESQQSPAIEEKLTSYMRTEMRTTAEAKGRRGDIAEAMVDRDVEIEGVDVAGKLLTLDTAKALALSIADLQADSLPQITDALGLKAPVVVEVSENWAEKLARFLTDPTVSGLLMSLGMLGLLVELYHPGVAFPGAVGVLCLTMFFGGHMVTHLAGLEEVMLLILGLGLLALEVFVIPGFGITGIAGILCIGASFVLTLLTLPLQVSWSLGLVSAAIERVGLSLFATIALGIVAVRFLPRTRAARKLVLARPTNIEAGYVSGPIATELLDVTGVAATDLRPAGKADLAGRRVDVVSEGDYIERGSTLQVVQARAGIIVVRKIP